MKQLIFILLFFTFFSKAQNLVPNWSFETYTACPNSGGQIPRATSWNCATACGEYFNSCASPPYNVPWNNAGGYQLAKDGNAYIALQTYQTPNYREYAQTSLIDTLTGSKCYYVEFFAVASYYVKYGCNNTAANFSKTQYSSSGLPLNIPQHITRYNNPIINDTVNWVQIAGIYQAGGGEKYLTIGNMKNDLGTDTSSKNMTGMYQGSYYYIDAVSVYSLNPTGLLPWTYRDTTVNYGDSVYIGNYLGGSFTSSWYTLPGAFIANGSGIYVKPTVTSDYVVSFALCGVPHSDTLKVTVVGNVGINGPSTGSGEGSEFGVSPNPNNGMVTIETQSVIEYGELKIKNVLGEIMKSEKCRNKKQTLDLSELPSGIYFLQLLQNEKIISTKKIVKQ